MGSLDRIRPHVLGEGWKGVILVLAVVGLLALSSVGFVSGMDVGLSPGWLVLAVAIAVVAGSVRAGLVPTIVSLWLIAFWWFVFPPLVGYLTGEWEMSSRYTYPRMLGYGYGSAYHELRGGLESGTEGGLLFALTVGTASYFCGVLLSKLSLPSKARRYLSRRS